MKVDVTHTVKESERPAPDARLLHDTKTGEREWEVPVPEGYFDGPPNPPDPAKFFTPPKPPKRKKKDSEGDK